MKRGDGNFVLAKNITVGDLIGNLQVQRILSTWQHVCCPLTRSGTIVVNGAPVSCFAFSNHWLARIGFMPANLLSFFGKLDSKEYTRNIRAFHAGLPLLVRSLLPVYI